MGILTKIKMGSYPVDGFFDSRGVQLNKGDMVLCLTEYRIIYTIGEVKLESNKLIVSARYSSNYLIKIPKTILYPINEYLNKLGLESSKYSDYSEICGDSILEGLRMNYCILNNGTMRGFCIVDYFAQDLKVGDFVIYKTENKEMKNQFKYGILISDTKVFNEDKILERVYYVYKLSDLNEEENKLYQILAISYKQMFHSKKDRNLSVGDVYVSGKDSYVYLGKIDCEVEHLFSTNTLFNVVLDKEKDYWFKINSGVPKNLIDLTNLMLKSIGNNTNVSLKSNNIKKYFHYNYYSIDKFKFLVFEKPKNSVFYLHIDIGDSLYFKDLAYYYERLHGFNFIFKLLDVK